MTLTLIGPLWINDYNSGVCFASSEGLNCSADTCSAVQRSLSLRTGASAVRRSLLCSQLLSFQTSDSDSSHAGLSAQQPLQRSLSCLIVKTIPQYKQYLCQRSITGASHIKGDKVETLQDQCVYDKLEYAAYCALKKTFNALC